MFRNNSWHQNGACLLTVLLITTTFIMLTVWQCQHLPSPRHDISSLRNAHNGQETTIVTAYFPLTRAKHSHSHYLSWLENLLSFCQSPMVIFTTADFHPILYRLRRNGSLPAFFIVNYKSPLQMPPIEPLVATFERQHQTDPERAYHSVELYAVWCAKSFMLNRSAELNPFRTKYFLYVDAGAFRSSGYRFERWPSKSSIPTIFSNQRLLLGMIAPLPRRFCPLQYKLNEGPISLNLVEGGFIGGSAGIIHWWTSVFYTTVHKYRDTSFFVGKDQTIMNAIALVHANRINMVLSFRVSCGDVWFAFAPLFAEKIERQNRSFSSACQGQNLSKVVIPFDTVCQDIRNCV